VDTCSRVSAAKVVKVRNLANRTFSLLLWFVGALSRLQKQAILLLVDVSLAPISLLMVYFFLYPVDRVPHMVGTGVEGFVIVALITGSLSLALGIPKIKLKAYETLGALKTGVLAVISAFGLLGLRQADGVGLPTSGILLFVLIFVLLMIAVRFLLLNILLAVLRAGKIRKNVVIYGAGNTGTQLAAALRSHESIRVVGFVDDSPKVQGMTILGVMVHEPSHLERLVQKYDVDRVLLAIPSAPSARQGLIVRDLVSKGLDVHRVPSFAQLVGTEKLLDSLEPVAPGSFLGRAPVADLQPEAKTAYRDQCVLVTGAGGSVGAELCRQLLRYRPRKIVLFEISEIALYTIDRELSSRPDLQGIQVIPVLGSVTESRLVRAVIAEHKVDVILHSAAYKHVPLVEANPIAGLVNNVLGTRTLAEAAVDEGVKRFILISTDKAVRPTNVMGASKRMAEFVVQDMARRATSTDFSIVRFGNVLGSSGSVVPLFREQILKGGPITLTHEDVTRYFMTISEAASLVLIAGSLSHSRGPHEGDLFVLDMGKPIRIRDLAERMIQAAGYTVKGPDTPDGDIEIVIIGLRPGEKLHEELLIEPGMLTTPHEKILRVQERSLTPMQIVSALKELRSAAAVGDAIAARRVVETYVEDFGSRANRAGRISQA